MSRVEFNVNGTPRAQGSKTGIIVKGRVVMVEGQNKVAREHYKAWRVAVRDAAKALAEVHGTFTGPLAVECHFRFASIKSEPHRHYYDSAPDGDKLLRHVYDSLTQSTLIADDKLVVSIIATKRYCYPDEEPGVRIAIESRAKEEADRRLDRAGMGF